ncbi:hypothetical protein CDAR_207131 [Caerostris darwini]|uniref:Uncharacterized protein n=1 Tax=Caerostris darwini TaxID=1538125 RepID=A0AAV4SNZ8_9ARAC|nr:hypothetical protein CDAR_207131 [Caerostris darwini]
MSSVEVIIPVQAERNASSVPKRPLEVIFSQDHMPRNLSVRGNRWILWVYTIESSDILFVHTSSTPANRPELVDRCEVKRFATDLLKASSRNAVDWLCVTS